MTRTGKTALAAALLALAGCASVHTIENPSPASIQQQVEPGDVVRVSVKDGRTFELAVEKVEAESLTGSTVENRRFRIPYSTIQALEVRDGQADGTSGVVALMVIAGIAVIVVVANAFEEFFDDLADAFTPGDE